MALPVTIPNTFAGATSAIPLSQLDNNFTTVVNGINGIGDGTNSLANVSITGGNITTLTTALTVPNGGTGLTTITSNNVVLGNGTGSVKVVAPGTTGNLLTSNGTTWISSAPASSGGSGWVYITSVTSSGAATIDVESAFDSTYDTYVIVANNVQGTSTNQMLMRLKIGGSYLTSNYVFSGFRVSSNTGTVVSNSDYSNLYILSNLFNVVDATASFNYIAYIFTPYSTTLYKQVNWLISGSSGNTVSQLTSQIYGMNTTNTSALTGVRFYQSASGNISGTFRLYGIKTS
jgi:hypothetical protein